MPSPRLTRLMAGLLAVALTASLPATATPLAISGETGFRPGIVAVDTQSKTSGGYTKPTPPAASSSTGTGGYTRPSGAAPAAPPPASAGDRDLSRQSSGDALKAYRQNQQEQARPAPAASSPPAQASGSPWSASGGYSFTDRTSWFGSHGWSPPVYVVREPQRFGIWDGMFMWFMLDTLNRSGHAAFFYNHEDDPGYRQWRAEADRMAADNADLRAKLAQLDQQIHAEQGRPRDAAYLPPDTDSRVALAPAAGGHHTGLIILLVVVIGGGVLVLLWWLRRPSRAASGAAAMTPPPSGPLGSAAAILRHKLSGETYSPSLFRVGMTITLDPTPFILAATATRVAAPVSGGDSLISVEAVGTLQDGAVTLYRLHLPGGRGFFQLHLDGDGHPDECRYFGQIDEIEPASAEDWGFWIDPAEGMIGWPQFQAKDGTLFACAWSPGTTRMEPRRQVEQRKDAKGGREIVHTAMLYARQTGAAEPGPPTEYLLVEAVEDQGRAWVAVHAGIDVNPAALALA